jgi:hypothetical protein
LAAGLAVAAVFAAVVVINNHQTTRTLIPAAPATTSAATDAPTTSPPTSVPPTTGNTPATDPPTVGLPLASVGDGGGPAAFGTVPAGYRVVMTDDGLWTQNQGAIGTDWAATFVRRPSSDHELAGYIQVQITNITDGDPYFGFPGLGETPDVTMGPFTGKVQVEPPGYLTFVVALSDSQRMFIDGRADAADIKVVAQNLRLRTEALGAVVTTLPTGYEFIGEGALSGGVVADREWRVSYAREQLQGSLMTVSARVHPQNSALADVMSPAPSRIVVINGFVGVLSVFGLTFDVSPTFQINLSRDTVTTPPGGAVSDDELIGFARSIVAISEQQFAELKDEAAKHPLTPTDMQCSFYIQSSAPRSVGAMSTAEGQTVISAPGSFTIDLTTTQPLGEVTIGVRTMMNPDVTTLNTLQRLTEPTTVNVAWDGTIGGQTAPAGIYVITLQATPAETKPGQCTPDTAGTARTIDVAFEVK